MYGSIYCTNSTGTNEKHIENNFINLTNLEFYELKGDKMPIGIHGRMNPFTNHIIQLQKGDFIYLMSDGYADQFGGSLDKKFYAKNVKQLISANCSKPPAEQKNIFDKTISDWIGDNDETDDITLLGIKL